MKSQKDRQLVRPIQSVQNVMNTDLAKIVTLTLAVINVAHLCALQIFATGERGEDGKTLVRMTILFQGPLKAGVKLASLVHIFLDQASENGSFKGAYSFDVSAKARRPVWNPMGKGPLGFEDRIWDRYCQLAA